MKVFIDVLARTSAGNGDLKRDPDAATPMAAPTSAPEAPPQLAALPQASRVRGDSSPADQYHQPRVC